MAGKTASKPKPKAKAKAKPKVAMERMRVNVLNVSDLQRLVAEHLLGITEGDMEELNDGLFRETINPNGDGIAALFYRNIRAMDVGDDEGYVLDALRAGEEPSLTTNSDSATEGLGVVLILLANKRALPTGNYAVEVSP